MKPTVGTVQCISSHDVHFISWASLTSLIFPYLVKSPVIEKAVDALQAAFSELGYPHVCNPLKIQSAEEVAVQSLAGIAWSSTGNVQGSVLCIHRYPLRAEFRRTLLDLEVIAGIACCTSLPQLPSNCHIQKSFLR